jgi:Ni/Fe-hydrogenase subunit HybB-like protein
MMSAATNSVKRPFLSVGNVITAIIFAIGLWLTYLRFTGGLGAVSNLDQNNPWGVWIGFDLLCGVALAAGGYTTAAAVEIFGLKKYHAALRPAILTGFLGYSMVVLALVYDVGRPWRLPYPFVVSQGVTSVMFEVGACVLLYLTVLFLEFSPIALEWLGANKLRKVVVRLTLLLTVLGVVLSTLHQSSLGALFLIAPSKLHPLWYTPYLPVFFFVSSIAAGLSMVIFEGTLARKNYADKMDDDHKKAADGIVIGFGKAASMVLAAYFTIKIFGVALGNNWHLLGTNYGMWFLFEILGFVLLPCLLFAIGVREHNLKLIRWMAVVTVVGIVVNRLNIVWLCFNWRLPWDERYVPNWMEIGISVFVITIGLTIYRFIVTRMPVFYEHPDYRETH